jgi:hypothetical protein
MDLKLIEVSCHVLIISVVVVASDVVECFTASDFLSDIIFDFMLIDRL